MEFLIGGLALLLGLAAGALWAGRRSAARLQSEAARAAGDLEAMRQQLAAAQRDADATRAGFEAWKASTEAQRRDADERRKELENAFAALSQQALKANSEAFLAQAGESLESRRAAIEALLKPFNETLTKLQVGAVDLEVKRESAYVALKQQIDTLHQATESLGRDSRSLGTALRGDARARGRWGEVQLRNIAEAAGMLLHCDFTQQVVLADGSRPDLIVKLPGGEAGIPVDAKAPMDAYMRAFETEDAAVRAQELARHARDLRGHVLALSRRDYPSALGAAVDITVMFVPSDAVLAAAFESEPSIQVEAMEKHVLLATPVTFMALLRTIAVYWKQVAIAESAQAMWNEARKLHERVVTFAEHLAKVRDGLDKAVKGYNEAVGSYEARVLPQGRRMEELTSPGGVEQLMPDLTAIERQLRDAPATEDGVDSAALRHGTAISE